MGSPGRCNLMTQRRTKDRQFTQRSRVRTQCHQGSRSVSHCFVVASPSCACDGVMRRRQSLFGRKLRGQTLPVAIRFLQKSDRRKAFPPWCLHLIGGLVKFKGRTTLCGLIFTVLSDTATSRTVNRKVIHSLNEGSFWLFLLNLEVWYSNCRRGCLLHSLLFCFRLRLALASDSINSPSPVP